MLAQELKHWPQTLAAAGSDQRLVEALGEGHYSNRVQMQQSQISKCRRQPLRVQEFRFSRAFAIHRFAAIQQNPHGNMQLGFVNLHEELSQPQVGAPIERAWIIAEAVTP